jgi:hypothetical protein
MKYPILVFLLVITSSTLAQEFENTVEYDSTMNVPAAGNLTALEWLAGSWRGSALGGTTDENWSKPIGGSMMCSFKLVKNNAVSFYELITISEENGSLVKRLRHFNSDLSGWEEKPLIFKLIKISPNRVYFDGFTYERISDNEMNIYAILQQRGGNKSEVKFSFRRVK